MLDKNTWNHLNEKMSLGSFKKCYQQNVLTNTYNYMYEQDLALNNLEVDSHKTQPNQT